MKPEDAIDRALEPDVRCSGCGRYSIHIVGQLCPACRWVEGEERREFERDQHPRRGGM